MFMGKYGPLSRFVKTRVLFSQEGMGDYSRLIFMPINKQTHLPIFQDLKKSLKTKRIAKMDDSPMHAQNEIVFDLTEAGIKDSED